MACIHSRGWSPRDLVPSCQSSASNTVTVRSSVPNTWIFGNTFKPQHVLLLNKWRPKSSPKATGLSKFSLFFFFLRFTLNLEVFPSLRQEHCALGRRQISCPGITFQNLSQVWALLGTTAQKTSCLWVLSLRAVQKGWEEPCGKLAWPVSSLKSMWQFSTQIDSFIKLTGRGFFLPTLRWISYTLSHISLQDSLVYDTTLFLEINVKH